MPTLVPGIHRGGLVAGAVDSSILLAHSEGSQSSHLLVPLQECSAKKTRPTSSKFENGQIDDSSETSGRPQERPRGQGTTQMSPTSTTVPPTSSPLTLSMLK